jgi:hypothetical protein|tara:strand:+ start:171 stop:479 length:309 start_codon:yes stop_codon:yes gene_type:complete
MKITKRQLKQIIKEELEAVLSEDDFDDYTASANEEVDCVRLGKQLQNARYSLGASEPGHSLYRGGVSDEESAAAQKHLDTISAKWTAKCKGVTGAHKVTQRA